MKGSELFEVLAHVFLGEVFHHRSEGVVVGDLVGESDFGLDLCVQCSEILSFRDVHEVDALLKTRVSTR